MVFGMPKMPEIQYIYTDGYITICSHCGDLWVDNMPPYPGDVIAWMK